MRAVLDRVRDTRTLRALAALAVLAGGVWAIQPEVRATVTPGGNGLIVAKPSGPAPDGDRLVAIDPNNGSRTILQQSAPQDARPEVSPDGRRVAFRVAPAGTAPPVVNGNIFVADFPSGANRIQVTTGGGFEAPAWSPDNNTLVFQCGLSAGTTGALCTANAAANAALNQLNGTQAGDRDPDFSPDGTQIVFAGCTAPCSSTGSKSIFRVPVGGGARTQLLFTDVATFTAHPRLSPNSTATSGTVYFEVSPPGGRIDSVSWPNGGNPSGAFNGTAGLGAQAPFPSPDGTKLGFHASACQTGDGGGLCYVASNGTGAITRVSGTASGDITGNWTKVNAPTQGAQPPGFVAADSPGGLVAFAPSTGQRVSLSGTSGVDNRPDVSPNGTKAAFENAGQILIADFPSGNNRQQVTSTGGNSAPSWAPDSGRLVYKCSSGLCTSPLGGTLPAAVQPLNGSTASDNNPVFSRDGRFVVFNVTAGSSQGINRINADNTGGRTQLTGTATGDQNPYVSPDGTYVVLDNQTVAGGTIFTLAFPNGGGLGPASVPGSQAGDINPFISPDGVKIGFTSTAGPTCPGGPPCIVTVNSNGTGGRAAAIGSVSGDFDGVWSTTPTGGLPTPIPGVTPTPAPTPKCPGHEADPRLQTVGTAGDDFIAPGGTLQPQSGGIVCGLAGNDKIVASTTGTGNLIEGGDGMDTTCAKNNIVDVIDGGGGVDRARFDTNDTVSNIEGWATATRCATNVLPTSSG
jgi:Tol biopolymer transport system component